MIRSKSGLKNAGGFVAAVLLCLIIYAAYFYYLVRDHLIILTQRQEALELIKAVAVPGTTYLRNTNALFIVKSSLFFLILLGLFFLVFQLLSLFFRSPGIRALFLSSGLIALIAVTYRDRIALSIIVILFLAFSSFYILTLNSSLAISRTEVLVLIVLALAVTVSLHFGARRLFFLKTRDRVLFDSRLGEKVVAYYYQYSPLAACVISPERGVYQGLIFFDEAKGNPYIHLGRGLFLSGDPRVKDASDFVVSRSDGKLLIRNRYAQTRFLPSMGRKDIQRVTLDLFSMPGFRRLNTFSLYFFPAGLTLLLLMGIKKLSQDKILFILSSTMMATAMIVFIWFISLIGKNPPDGRELDTVDIETHGLSIAYHLHEKENIPDRYRPFVKRMAGARSPALRYWGARLLCKMDDPAGLKSLKSLMSDPSPNVRYSAAESYYRLQREKGLTELLPLLMNDPNWYVRCIVFSIFLRAGIIPHPA